ncbi:TetR/AcrR family transcriptional regulator [Microscilla marina]|uniref:Transcriptional regulator, TetR family, putative n=1 Tax=Microscilla marina ATCC 23134 TaxID=313606 RepID=A2A089_MICM2|nr:TetR/AcrR family transcriptional regulator [Microscilla marina]EAY23954.1 transcriptional regulator, TetR family, putative [Microscilla marina ATCC 23134]
MQKDEEIQEFILQKAKKLFQRYGLKKTTMEEIAKAAGKGKSTLYYYFKSKDEIFEAVVKQETEQLHKELKELTSQANDVQTRLKLYCITHLQKLKEKVNLYQIVFSELSDQMGMMYELRKKFNHFELDFLTQILTEGVENNEIELSREDIEWFAVVMSAAMKGIETHLVLFEQHPNLEDKAGKMIDMFYHGIKRRK